MGLYQSLTQETIDTIATMATDKIKGDQAETVADFTRRFYDHVPPGDILGQDKENLFGAAVSMWSFARKGHLANPKSRCTTPILKPMAGRPAIRLLPS